MARVPLLGEADINDENRDVLSRRINLYWTVGHSVGGARAYSTMGLWLRHESKFDPRLRELAILTVGYLARAEYEWAHHIEIGYDFGVTDADIERLIRELEGETTDLEPVARHIIRGAKEIAADGAMGDASWAALSAEFDNELMVELTLGTAFYCAIVRVLKTLQVPLEDEARKYLDKYPLPA